MQKKVEVLVALEAIFKQLKESDCLFLQPGEGEKCLKKVKEILQFFLLFREQKVIKVVVLI